MSESNTTGLQRLPDEEFRRVLCVVALADNVKQAQPRAYAAVQQVQLAGMQYRSDIGHRAIA